MKNKEKQQARKASHVEIEKEVETVRKAYTKFSVERYTKEMKNSRLGRGMRKKLAVLLSFQKELQAAPSKS